MLNTNDKTYIVDYSQELVTEVQGNSSEIVQRLETDLGKSKSKENNSSSPTPRQRSKGLEILANRV